MINNFEFIYSAAKENKALELSNLVKEGKICIDERRDKTLFASAGAMLAEEGNVVAVKLLIRLGANVNLMAYGAAKGYKLDLLTYLEIEHTANVNWIVLGAGEGGHLELGKTYVDTKNANISWFAQGVASGERKSYIPTLLKQLANPDWILMGLLLDPHYNITQEDIKKLDVTTALAEALSAFAQGLRGQNCSTHTKSSLEKYHAALGAAAGGNYLLAETLIEEDQFYWTGLACKAAFCGHRSYSEYLREKYAVNPDFIAASAAAGGHHGYAEWLRQYHNADKDIIAFAAALRGHRYYAEYLRNEGGAYYKIILQAAIFSGDLNYCELLRRIQTSKVYTVSMISITAWSILAGHYHYVSKYFQHLLKHDPKRFREFLQIRGIPATVLANIKSALQDVEFPNYEENISQYPHLIKKDFEKHLTQSFYHPRVEKKIFYFGNFMFECPIQAFVLNPLLLDLAPTALSINSSNEPSPSWNYSSVASPYLVSANTVSHDAVKVTEKEPSTFVQSVGNDSATEQSKETSSSNFDKRPRVAPLVSQAASNFFPPSAEKKDQPLHNSILSMINHFSEIYQLAKDNDEQGLKDLISTGVCLDERESGTPYRSAGAKLAEEGKVDGVLTLIKLGANINLIAYGAAKGKQTDLLNRLLCWHPDINWIALGAAEGNHLSFYEEQIKNNNANVNWIARGTALGKRIDYALFLCSKIADIKCIIEVLFIAYDFKTIPSSLSSFNLQPEFLNKTLAFCIGFKNQPIPPELENFKGSIAFGYAAGGQFITAERYRISNNIPADTLAAGAAFFGHIKYSEYLRIHCNAKINVVAGSAAGGGNTKYAESLISQGAYIDLIAEKAAQGGHAFFADDLRKRYEAKIDRIAKGAAQCGDVNYCEFLIRELKVNAKLLMYWSQQGGHPFFADYLRHKYEQFTEESFVAINSGTLSNHRR